MIQSNKAPGQEGEVNTVPFVGSFRRHVLRFGRIRLLAASALVALSLTGLHVLLGRFSEEWDVLPLWLAYGLVVTLTVVWAGWSWLKHVSARQEQTERELERARAELERTRRQLETILEVGRRVASAADVQELLEIAARVPVALLNARATTVVTLDPEKERAELEMAWGLDEAAVCALRHCLQHNFPAERCRQCRPLTALLVQDCPLLMALQQAGRASFVQQVVCLPLGRGQERTGIVAAYLERPAPLTTDQLNLISILGAEISAALEGVRLRSRQTATFYAVDRITQERQDLDVLVERVLETTVAGWGAQAGAILLAEGDENTWTVRAHVGLGEGLSAPSFCVVLRAVAEARQASRVLTVRERSDEEGLASTATVLLQAEGETLGALFLGATRPGTFSHKHGDLLLAIGHQIALAIRNAQLYSRLRQMAVLEERYRLSREMHDGLAQTLGYLSMQAERLERLLAEGQEAQVKDEVAELRRAIAEAYLDVREAIDGLRLNVEEYGDLARALQLQLEDFARRTGLAVDGSNIQDPGALPADVALQLLRISQEALTNVRRHARARHVWVHLVREGDYVELTVADDGQGFDPALTWGRHHVGLASMRERARSVGGQFTLATRPGQGTRVIVRVPVSPSGVEYQSGLQTPCIHRNDSAPPSHPPTQKGKIVYSGRHED